MKSFAILFTCTYKYNSANNKESNQLTFKFKKHLNINLEQAAKYIKPIDSAQASFNEWSPITKTTETIRLDYQKGNAFCSNHYLTFNSTVDKYPILNKEKSDFLYYTNGNEMIPRFRNNSITKQLWWNEIKFLFITKLVFTPYLESKSDWTQQQADKWIAMYKEYAQYIFAGKPVMNSPMDLVNPCAFKLDKTNQNNEFILTINPKTYNPWGNEKKSTTLPHWGFSFGITSKYNGSMTDLIYQGRTILTNISDANLSSEILKYLLSKR